MNEFQKGRAMIATLAMIAIHVTTAMERQTMLPT